jgi:glycosyltransferase involved in cell wall biosynthesis
LPPAKLSICIPTCERARYLDRLLTHLERDCRFPFDTEIVVSDNASTDGTPGVIAKFRSRFPLFTAFRQAHRVEGTINARAVLRAASGDYVVYVADDDFLLPGAIAPIVAALDANPTLTAIFAPWEVYDLTDSVALRRFYDHKAPASFGMPQALDALEFMLDHHVLPEIGIYRAAAFTPVLFPGRFTYWAFTNLVSLMSRGSVLFHPTPFYRSVIRQEAGQVLQQAGAMEARTSWDIYRGGLEYFLHHAERLAPESGSAERRGALETKITRFIQHRMTWAMKLWADAGEALKAYELLIRLRAGKGLTAAEDAAWTERLRMRAAVQAAVLSLDDVPGEGRARLVLAGVKAPSAFLQLAREMRAPPRMEEFDVKSDEPLLEPDKCICIRGQGVSPEELVKRGVPPGRIISEADLLLTCL